MSTSLKHTSMMRRDSEFGLSVRNRLAHLLRRFAGWLDGDLASVNKTRWMDVGGQPAQVDAGPTDPAHVGSEEKDIELLTLGRIVSVLERQLAEVNSDIEESIVGIAKGFQGMAIQAQSAVSAVGSVAGDPAGENSSFSDMQTVIGGLVQHMNESCESLGGAANRLAEMERRLDGVETVLTGIEEIAARSRLMALNGQIEAGRLGAAGAAFAVVASETKQLSEHAAGTSSQAQDLLSELATEITTTTKELRARSDSDASRLARSQQEAQSVLSYIRDSHAKTMVALQEAGSISRELQGSIHHAVMSLQFQDRVSQRMGHVIESLRMICQRIDACADRRYATQAESKSSEILSDLAKSYTMDSERLALADGQGNAQPSGESMDIELF